ncbi:hypothetical protein N869_03790, partial [Cellulomonas bogoriensis 69B4 = DSM 16987]
MRVLIAPDCFTGTLTAPQAAAAIADGWAQGAPHDEVTTRPLSDGGPGFLEVVRSGIAGTVPTVLAVTVPGPWGDPVPAAVLLDEAGGTAYVEAAQAIGLHLIPEDRRDPARTSSDGLGHLLRAAISTGARRIVVGVGGTGTNDAGAGVLAGLGMQAEVLVRGGGALDAIDLQDLTGLPDLRA